MFNLQTQQANAQLLHSLHHNGEMLVLPNIWDPLGAALLQDLGYPAVATASASMAYTNGYEDGENIPFGELLHLLTKIAASVNIPVTADIECGFSNTDAGLEENIRLLVEAGIVGINIEDSDKETGSLFPIEVQCKKIALIRRVAAAMEIPLFINARTDVYIKGSGMVSNDEKLQETLKRGHAYINAGADSFYPIFVKNEAEVRYLVSSIPRPVNILAVPGVPDLKTLRAAGVARVSLGPSLLKIAMQAMKDAVIKLKAYENISELINNEITGDYLTRLVQKNQQH